MLIEIKDNNIFWLNSQIYFFRRDCLRQMDIYFTAEEIIARQTDCGWSFELPLADGGANIVGIMMPVMDFELRIGDNIPIKNRCQRYYYNINNELANILKLNLADFNQIDRPIAHCLVPDRAYAWSCPNEGIISVFNHQYRWFFNFEVLASENTTFFLDVSSNYQVNLQRYPVKKPEILINTTTDLCTMKKALLLGAIPRKQPNRPHSLIRNTRNTQLELSKHNIQSLIIGSLARRLNGIPVDVHDLDLMVNDQDFDKAVSVLESFSDRIWLKSATGRFKSEEITIDLCCDNYNLLNTQNYTHHRHGLTYLDSEGLLWLYMINLFACNVDEHAGDYHDKIIGSISSICHLQPAEFNIIPYAKDMPDLSETCFKLCKQLSESTIQYRDIRINDPFVVRSFQNELNLFCAIINCGSMADMEITIDIVAQKATWTDIAGNVKEGDIQIFDCFSVVRVENIRWPGVLECKAK